MLSSYSSQQCTSKNRACDIQQNADCSKVNNGQAILIAVPKIFQNSGARLVHMISVIFTVIKSHVSGKSLKSGVVFKKHALVRNLIKRLCDKRRVVFVKRVLLFFPYLGASRRGRSAQNRSEA